MKYYEILTRNGDTDEKDKIHSMTNGQKNGSSYKN